MAHGPASGDRPRVYHDDGHTTVATFGPYVLWWLRTHMTYAILDAADAACADIVRTYGTIGYIALFEPDATVMMPSEFRAPSAQFVARYSDRFFGAAMVYEPSGFKATVVRSVITAVHLASRARHPLRVTSDLAAAVDWLEGAAPVHVRQGSEALLAELLGFREQVRGRLATAGADPFV